MPMNKLGNWSIIGVVSAVYTELEVYGNWKESRRKVTMLEEKMEYSSGIDIDATLQPPRKK